MLELYSTTRLVDTLQFLLQLFDISTDLSEMAMLLVEFAESLRPLKLKICRTGEFLSVVVELQRIQLCIMVTMFSKDAHKIMKLVSLSLMVVSIIVVARWMVEA